MDWPLKPYRSRGSTPPPPQGKSRGEVSETGQLRNSVEYFLLFFVCVCVFFFFFLGGGVGAAFRV